MEAFLPLYVHVLSSVCRLLLVPEQQFQAEEAPSKLCTMRIFSAELDILISRISGPVGATSSPI